MKHLRRLAGVAVCLLMIFQLFGCAGFPSLPESPKPGTVGFYHIQPISDWSATEDVTARRMSNQGDTIYVYRINGDMVVLGVGNKDTAAKIKPFDEVVSGVEISPEGAKALAAYLEKVIARYDDKEKKTSEYMDFRILTNGDVNEGEETPKDEFIKLRFQYVFNMYVDENAEKTSYYMGGSANASPKTIEYNDIKILISNLQKE